MIYLTGVTSDRDEPQLIAAGVGLMVQPGNSYHRRVDRYPWFAADNGCFADRWDEDRHLSWLDRLPRDRCLFAVAPDVYPDAAASLERGRRYFELIRGMGYPVALVAQDGAESLDLPWDEFDCLFLGGERTADPLREWKVGHAAARLTAAARAHGKWVHMGRVNGESRLRRAKDMGCNSADGTFIKYRRRARATDALGDVDGRGAGEIGTWLARLAVELRLFETPFEMPALPIHRDAIETAG